MNISQQSSNYKEGKGGSGNLRALYINDLKKEGSITMFFATRAHIQKVWRSIIPIRVMGTKLDRDGNPAGQFDFVKKHEFIHPGSCQEDTTLSINAKKCAYTSLYNFLRNDNTIAPNTVILSIPYTDHKNGGIQAVDEYTKEQILGEWTDPTNPSESYKGNVPAPHGSISAKGRTNDMNHWLFPVLDKRDSSTLKVLQLPYGVGCTIFEVVKHGIGELGEEGDPAIVPHEYVVKFNRYESNPQKKYEVNRYVKNYPTGEQANVLASDLDTKLFVKPAEAKYINYFVYHALADKSLWERLDIEDKTIFDGTYEQAMADTGVYRKPNPNRNNDQRQAQAPAPQQAPAPAPTTPQQAPAPAPAPQQAQTKPCVQCATGLELNAKFCPACGTSQEQQVPAQQAPQTPPAPQGFATPTQPPVPATPPPAPAPVPQTTSFGGKANPASGNYSPPQQTAPAANSADQDKVICSCGTENMYYDIKCSSCGAAIDGVPF